MQDANDYPMEITLSNVKFALMQIHVCGAEAGMLDGAIKGVDLALEAIRKAKEWEKAQKEKEGAANADCNEQRKDV